MKKLVCTKKTGVFATAALLFLLFLPGYIHADKKEKVFVVLAEYQLPYLNEVTMPENWMQGFLANMGDGNEKLLKAESINGMVTWNYNEHGLAPWMQFFYDWRFADLNNDNQMDFIFYSGAKKQTAFLNDGTILWQHENEEAHCYEIRFDSPFPVYDIDKDQTPEFICVRKIDGQLKLCIVDANTNVLEKSAPFPQFNDNYVMLRILNTEGDEHPSEIMLQLIHHSVLVYNQNLELLWEISEEELQEKYPRNHRIMAHSQAFYDVDNDGRDEILAGSVLLDDDGTALWVMPDLEALVKDSHSDCNLMVPLGFDLQPNLLTSTGGYCFNAKGELLWEGKDFFNGNDYIHHGQTVLTGNVRSDIEGLEVVLYDNAHRVSDRMDRVFATDNRGNLLWKFETLTPNIQEGGFGFALGDWNGDGYDEIIVNDKEKINVINGFGEVIATLPHHLIYAMDLYGDQRTELVVLTGIEPGMKMKIIGNGVPNNYPAKIKSSAERNNNPAIYNKIRY